ncbi:MAG: hypothetical protein LBU27_02895 [Candidatus Peribacteria bacterium]|nr:hypothetical protein [Candidatus Peribacteria bacterium]
MTKRKLYLRAGKIIAIFTFFCLLFNQSTMDFILYRQGAFIPKMTFIFFAIFFVDARSDKLRYWWKVIKEFKFVGHKIDGIPSKKLLHIITTTNELSYENFTRNIASDKNLYAKI